MPLKFFMKLYGRLIGLTVIVIGLCLTLFWGVNSVRLQAWQEQFPSALMHWLASVPAPQTHYHWLDSLYDFENTPLSALSVPPVLQERLRYGQVVTLKTPLGPRVMIQDANGDVLSLRVRNVYRDVSEIVALMIRTHLSNALPDERDAAMEGLAEVFSVQLRAPTSEQMVPDEEVLARAMERGIAFYRDDGGQGRVLIRLSDGTLVQQIMAAPFSAWAWPVLSLLMLFIGSVVAGTLYLLLRGVDQNLRSVESVAVRIARGEMDARVDAGDSTLVTRLALAFNSMAEHIQRLVGVQREMIHAVSHELRTPVARIRFGVQMIEDCDDPDDLQKQLEGIDGDIQELDELIDEILTYARLEQGGPVFSLQEASVTDIVRQVVSEQSLIHAGVVIEADISEATESWALSDVEPRYLHRAIQNLVGNAARYAAGRVSVCCYCDEQTCRVDVEDDGPGIPESDWERVFTAFARLDDSRTRTSGGYGLGLSIVRRILFWHGGQAFVSRSSELGGARFSLVWPRRKPDYNQS